MNIPLLAGTMPYALAVRLQSVALSFQEAMRPDSAVRNVDLRTWSEKMALDAAKSLPYHLGQS